MQLVIISCQIPHSDRVKAEISRYIRRPSDLINKKIINTRNEAPCLQFTKNSQLLTSSDLITKLGCQRGEPNMKLYKPKFDQKEHLIVKLFDSSTLLENPCKSSIDKGKNGAAHQTKPV